jgi:hypothetical protein
MLCDAGACGTPAPPSSAQDHFQGAPTDEIKATNVAMAVAARAEV